MTTIYDIAKAVGVTQTTVANEPTWIATPGNGWDPTNISGSGDQWDNQTLFNWSGVANPAIALFKL